MKLQEIMTKDFKTVGPETRLSEAAAIMRDEGVGMLPVLGMGRVPIGAITDRDITVRALANGLDSSTPVREVMTSLAYALGQERELDDALALMESAKVGRVMVCDADGALRGVLSLGDAYAYCDDRNRPTLVSRALAERNREAINSRATASLR